MNAQKLFLCLLVRINNNLVTINQDVKKNKNNRFYIFC